jgi:hypothetical protein
MTIGRQDGGLPVRNIGLYYDVQQQKMDQTEKKCSGKASICSKEKPSFSYCKI